MLRHEHKMVISQSQYIVLSARMRALMTPDSHMPSAQGYLISSLYFDDAQESAYYEKLSGSAERKKYRLRIYNGALSRIRLECKYKAADRIDKRSALVGEDVYRALVRGGMRALADVDDPLCREHRRVMDGALNVLSEHSCVKADRGIEIVRRRRGAFLCSSRPHFFVRHIESFRRGICPIILLWGCRAKRTAPRHALNYFFSFLALTCAPTWIGSPQRLIKPAESAWLYTLSSPKVAISSE